MKNPFGLLKKISYQINNFYTILLQNFEILMKLSIILSLMNK